MVAIKLRLNKSSSLTVKEHHESFSAPPVIPKNVEQSYHVQGSIAPLRKDKPIVPTCSNTHFLKLTRTWDNVYNDNVG
jgi:hypothetical protein